MISNLSIEARAIAALAVSPSTSYINVAFAVETLGDEIDSLVDGALAQAFWKELHGRPENDIDAAKQQEPDPALMRRLRRRPNRSRGLDKKLVDADAERIFRARAQRLQHQ